MEVNWDVVVFAPDIYENKNIEVHEKLLILYEYMFKGNLRLPFRKHCLTVCLLRFSGFMLYSHQFLRQFVPLIL